MKRRTLIVTSIALLIIAMASMSFANGGYGHRFTATNEAGYGHMYNNDYTEEELKAFHEERIQLQKEAIVQYLEEGKITQEQHDNWLTHIEDMEKFHEENGFVGGMGPGYGGCRRRTITQ